MMERFLRREEGQGVVEYALILVPIAVVAFGILLLLGPALSHAFSDVVVVFQHAGSSDPGPIIDLMVGRSGMGHGNDVVVMVTVSESTTVTAIDSQSGRSTTFSCRRTCQDTITGVGDAAGTITVTSGWDSNTARYPAKW